MDFRFFGGGAAFFALVVLQKADEQTLKNWAVFAICMIFALAAIYLFVTTLTRIEVSQDEIVLRRLFRGKRRFLLSSVLKAKLAGKNPATGIKLIFSDGKQLKLLSSYTGYASAVAKIQGTHPDVPRLLMLGRMVNSIAEKAQKKQRA